MSRVTFRVSIGVALVAVLLVGCPPQPTVEAFPDSHHYGVVGEPPNQVLETTWTFQVWNGNAGGSTLVFEVAATKPWIAVQPATGQSTGPDDHVEILVTIDRNYSELTKALPEFLSGAVHVTSDVGNKVIPITTAPDYFTEEFDAGLDVANTAFVFQPDGSLNYYLPTQQAAVGFGTDPAGGVVLDFSIADPVEVRPWYGQEVGLYGIDYDTFYVSSAGFVGFGPGAASAKAGPTLDEHFSTPRISALSSADAAAGGAVSVLQDAEKVAVTYQGVPTGAKQGDNDFQIEMFLDGTIRVTYLGLDAASGIVGLSYGPGGGTPLDFLESDFSGYTNTPPLKAAF